ncbi:MAG: prepilin-type N-terminal cleavage/methylation domain-containing protein [Planctomycetota bacterium]
MIMRRDTGFTLIEIVVVLAIMTLLVGIAAPSLAGIMNSQRGSATDVEMDALVTAAKSFCEDTVQRPADLDALYSSALPGFGGPYVDDSLGGRDVEGEGFRHDAWGRRYRYETPGNTGILITSAGRDGQFDTDDDIVRDVDLQPVFRRISIERLEILNLAVTAYNKTYLASAPLSSSVASAVGQLVSSGYLPAAGDFTRDAFGDLFVAAGSPVVRFMSPNFGTEGSSVSADPAAGSSVFGGSNASSANDSSKDKKGKKGNSSGKGKGKGKGNGKDD